MSKKKAADFDVDSFLAEGSPAVAQDDFDVDSFLADGAASELPTTTPTGLVATDQPAPNANVTPAGQPIYNKYGFQEIYPRTAFKTEGDYREFHENPIFGATPETYPYTIGGVRKDTASGAIHVGAQGVGLVAGQAAVPVPVVGAGLGAAAGEAVADAADVAMGLQDPTKMSDVPKKLVSTLGEGMAAAIFDKTLNLVLGGAVKWAANPFNRAQAQETAERIANVAVQAKENGIDLTPAQITNKESLNFLEKLFSKTLASSKYADAFKTKQIKQMLARREALLLKGNPADAEVVGHQIQELTDKYITEQVWATNETVTGIKDTFLKQLGSSEGYYSLGKSAQELVEQTKLLKSDGVRKAYEAADKLTPTEIQAKPENFVKALSKVSDEISQAEPILQESPIAKQVLALQRGLDEPAMPKAIQDIDAMLANIPEGVPARKALEIERHNLLQEAIAKGELTFPQRNFFQLRENMRQIGDLAAAETSKTGTTSVAGRWYKILDDALGTDQKELIKLMEKEGHQGVAAAHELARLKAISRFNYLDDPVVKTIGDKHPEAIVHSVFANVDDIQRYKTVTQGTNLFDRAKKVAASDIFKADPNGNITGDAIRKRVADFGERAQAIWTPAELDAFQAAAAAIDGTQSMGKELVSNKILGDIVKAHPEDVANVIVKNGAGAVNLVGSQLGQTAKKGVARAYLPEIFLKGQKEGNFDPFMAEKALDAVDEKTLNALYDPSFIKEMRSFIEVSKRAMEHPTPNAQHLLGVRASLGGASLLFAWSYGKDHPGTVGIVIPTVLLARQKFAQMYFNNPTTRKWLLEGLTIPAWSKRAGDLTSKLVSAIAAQTLSDNDQPNYTKE